LCVPFFANGNKKGKWKQKSGVAAHKVTLGDYIAGGTSNKIWF
jgi:hypothetical protein